MHSRDYLDVGDFAFMRGTEPADAAAMFPDWTPTDRVALVAPDPIADTGRLAGPALAWTALFYGRPEAGAPDFFDYPNHYVVGGEHNATPQILGPGAEAEWSRAWCKLDAWPSTHHAVAAPEADVLMAACFMLEPTVLVWPARLSPPGRIDLPAGPDENVARRLLQTRIREVWFYGDEPRDQSAAWRLEYGGGAGQLARDAADLLPARPETVDRPVYLERTDAEAVLSAP